MEHTLILLLVYMLVSALPSFGQDGMHCGFPGQPRGGFITSPSLVMPINSNQWNQPSVYGWNQQLTRNQQTYNGGWNQHQFGYQNTNWQYQSGPYSQPNLQQSSQQINAYQMKPGQSYMPPSVSTYDGTNQILSHPQVFNTGDVVTYSCREGSYDILIGRPNRTCQEDGTWSGSRPWCDINVAYRRPVTFDDFDGKTSYTGLITDGVASADDGAECILLKRGGGAYFTLDIGIETPVRDVQIFGKPGEGVGNLVGSKVTLGTSVCQEPKLEKALIRAQCNREYYQISPSNILGNTIRFEHTSQFALDVCEIVAYANPTLADCGEPEIPAHGNATLTTNSVDQVVTYTCNYGYELRGNPQRTCRGRSWDGQQPICVEVPVVSTTADYNTMNPIDYPVNEAFPVFGIVLIIVCIALAIGLLVAFLVLMKYGKLKCCMKQSKPPSKKDYAPVTATSSSSTTPVSSSKIDNSKQTAANKDTKIDTRLAYTDEKSQGSNSVFSDLESEPRNISPPAARNDGESGVIYTEIQGMYAPAGARKESDDTSTISSLDEAAIRRGSPKSVRKSYVPVDYAKHSPPEVQAKQRAVNEELSVRISRTTDF